MNLGYKVLYSSDAHKQLRKMDRQMVKEILTWVDERLVDCQNPRLWGEALVGNFSGLWKYRIGEFRLVCEIKDRELVVYVIDVGNRKNIYR